jgi:hypothetical protein
MKMRKCAVDNCDKDYFCKTFCQMHYDLMRRRGTLDKIRPPYIKVASDIKDKIKDVGKGRRGFLAVNIVNDIKFKAKQRGKTWSLTGEQAFKLITSACYYCGFIPTWPTNRVGIDRVKNSQGYLVSNCVPCCFTCNSAKKELSQEEFYLWVKQI